MVTRNDKWLCEKKNEVNKAIEIGEVTSESK